LPARIGTGSASAGPALVATRNDDVVKFGLSEGIPVSSPIYRKQNRRVGPFGPEVKRSDARENSFSRKRAGSG
jgi:hypothetical protein